MRKGWEGTTHLPFLELPLTPTSLAHFPLLVNLRTATSALGLRRPNTVHLSCASSGSLSLPRCSTSPCVQPIHYQSPAQCGRMFPAQMSRARSARFLSISPLPTLFLCRGMGKGLGPHLSQLCPVLFSVWPPLLHQGQMTYCTVLRSLSGLAACAVVAS